MFSELKRKNLAMGQFSPGPNRVNACTKIPVLQIVPIFCILLCYVVKRSLRTCHANSVCTLYFVVLCDIKVLKDV